MRPGVRPLAFVGRGDGHVMRNPLRLAFEAREGAARSKPARSHFGRGEGYSMRNPLRLAFEGRGRGWVARKKAARLHFEQGGGQEVR